MVLAIVWFLNTVPEGDLHMSKKIALFMPLTNEQIQNTLTMKPYSYQDEVVYLSNTDASAYGVDEVLLANTFVFRTIYVDDLDTTSVALVEAELRSIAEDQIDKLELALSTKVTPVLGEYCLKQVDICSPTYDHLFRVSEVNGTLATITGLKTIDTVELSTLFKVDVLYADDTGVGTVSVCT